MADSPNQINKEGMRPETKGERKIRKVKEEKERDERRRSVDFEMSSNVKSTKKTFLPCL